MCSVEMSEAQVCESSSCLMGPTRFIFLLFIFDDLPFIIFRFGSLDRRISTGGDWRSERECVTSI